MKNELDTSIIDITQTDNLNILYFIKFFGAHFRNLRFLQMRIRITFVKTYLSHFYSISAQPYLEARAYLNEVYGEGHIVPAEPFAATGTIFFLQRYLPN